MAILIVRFNNDCDAIQNREVHYAIRYLNSCENKVILDVTRHKAKKILLTPFLLAFVNRVPWLLLHMLVIHTEFHHCEIVSSLTIPLL